MSLRKKFAEILYVPFFIGGGLAAGGLIGDNLDDNNWDLERSKDADQIIQKFETGFEKISALKEQNEGLDAQFSNILLDLNDEERSVIQEQYVSNEALLEKQSLQLVEQVLSSDQISEKDFEALATDFNTLGLSKYTPISINPDNANALKECNVDLSPMSTENDYRAVSSCMEDKNEHVALLILAALGAGAGLFFGGAFETSTIRQKWLYASDKSKSKKNKSGEKLGARLKRSIGLPPKRPQN